MTSSQISALLDQMWAELVQTQISGKKFHDGGEVAPGHWLAAKGYRDQIKAALAAAPTVAITAPAAGATVSGKTTVTGTAQ